MWFLAIKTFWEVVFRFYKFKGRKKKQQILLHNVQSFVTCTCQQIVLITESVCPLSFYQEKLKNYILIYSVGNAYLLFKILVMPDSKLVKPTMILPCLPGMKWVMPLWKHHSSWHRGQGSALREKIFLTKNLATLQMVSFNLPVYIIWPKGQKVFLDFRVKRTFFIGLPTPQIIDNFAFLNTAMIFAISSKTLSFW